MLKVNEALTIHIT